jgi:uncharacterized protein YjbJ (UPF0337 family)
MNTDILTGQWKQIRGKVQEQWGKLTNDELDQINGRVTELAGLLQTRYGYEKERAEREINDFMQKL